MEKVHGRRGSVLLQHVGSVDRRNAEGLEANEDAPTTTKEMEEVLEIQKRLEITDPYQAFLYDVRAMHKKGNYRGTEGETILQRIRIVGENHEKSLDLAGFHIRDDFTELLIPYLKSSTCMLTMLNMDRTQIGVESAAAIARSINSTLEMLQFSEHPLPIAAFRKDASTLRYVVLSDKRYNHLDAAAMGVLAERESRKLERLDVSNNPLTGLRSNIFHGLTILFTGLKKCPRLRELDLHSVGLHSEGITDLANAICDLPAIEKLNLSHNHIGTNCFGDKNLSGVEWFCNELWQAKKLKDLCLSHNELDYTACTAVAKMLTVNQHIKCLDLSHNPLSNAGAVQLATGIKNNAILEILDLSVCAFDCDAVHALAENLRKFNRTIKTVRLCGNPLIRSHGYKEIVRCVTINPILQTIEMTTPRKYEKYWIQIHDLLNVNAAFAALCTDATTLFQFETLGAFQKTNFIEKLKEMSELQLYRIAKSHVLDEIQIGLLEKRREATVSSLRYYSEMEQYAPLKRLLWVLESSTREAVVEKRPTRKTPTHSVPIKGKRQGINRNRVAVGHVNQSLDDEEEDEEDIWDYPIAI